MNKKSWHNNLRGLFLIGLFFCSQFVYSQDPQTINNSDAFAPSKATVTTPEITPSPEPTNGMLESEIHDEMDNSAEEIMKQQAKLKAQMDKMQNPEAGLVKQTEKLDTEKMLKNLIQASNPEISKDQLEKMKLSEAIRLAMGPLKKLSSNEMKSMILDQARGSKHYNLLIDFPKILDFFVGIIKDENAVPQMVKVIEDKEKLKKFAAVMLCSIVFGFIIARIISTKEKNIYKIVGLFFFRVLIMFSIRISIICYFYSEELSPAFNVFTRVLFS